MIHIADMNDGEVSRIDCTREEFVKRFAEENGCDPKKERLVQEMLFINGLVVNEEVVEQTLDEFFKVPDRMRGFGKDV